MTLASTLGASTQKKIYIPQEWKNNSSTYMESDPDNKAQYSKSRSKESDNFIVYWEKGYGNTIPTDAPETYRVDIDDLLEKAEWFYSLNVGKLGFCDEKNSKVSQYKMIICLLHDAGWTATGSGYDNVIGALWVTPSTCKPVGHTIAHEIGHSFQYQCFCDLGGYAGFRTAIGSGSTFWEQTAQWQAAQAYPDQAWTESWLVYGTPFFPNTYNYAMTHEHMRYQSYWWHYYLADKYGIDIIGKLWRHDAGKGVDPNEVLMDMMGWDAFDLYKAYFDYAMHMATADIDAIRDAAQPYLNSYPYNFQAYRIDGNRYEVAYSCVPQSTGFNVIPLNVPEAGTTVTTEFTSPKSPVKIAADDPVEYHNGDTFVAFADGKTYFNINSSYNKHRGYRLGYVALLNDGTRQYIYEDSLYCADDSKAGNKTVSLSATVPENTKKLWFVVVPAPREYYQHKWNEKIDDDDQWPYIVEFTGTNIAGLPIIDENLPITDATITYNVEVPNSNVYSSTVIRLGSEVQAALGTAFQMQAADVASHLKEWSSAEPADGEIKFYALNPTTGSIVNQGNTANGYGHWFNAKGVRCTWGNDSYVYSEYYPTSLAFIVGLYPGHVKDGDTYTIGQAFKYHRGDETALVKFIFNVTITAPSSPEVFEVASIEQSDIVTGISAPQVRVGEGNGSYHDADGSYHGADGTYKAAGDSYNGAAGNTSARYFTLSGTPLSAPQRGFNLVKQGGEVRKVYVK